MNKKDFIFDFTNNIKTSFPSNLRGILLYGSATGKLKDNDFDIIIILKEKKNITDDLDVLNNLLKKFKRKNIDLQLLYNEEIENPDLFSLDTHGCFIVKILQGARVLFGENPFKNVAPRRQSIKNSILNKIQYYVFRARQNYFGKRTISKDTNKDFHRKKIYLAMQDILLFDNDGISSEYIIQNFIKKYPGLLTINEITLLKKHKKISLKILMPIYEKLYSLILRKSKNELFAGAMIKSQRLKIENMAVEYLLPSNSTNKIIILCDGLPSIPCQIDLMNILAQNEYAVFFPRYSGTWESGGVFLEKSPREDIIKICKFLKSAKINGISANPSIFLIGSSFGGGITLSVGSIGNVRKIISLSPVYDFKEISGADSLKKFIKQHFAGAYRFHDNGWNDLFAGKLLSPANFINKENCKKHFIITGAEDKEILPENIKKFGNNFGLKVLIYPGVGHLSFNKLKNSSILTKVLDILSYRR